MDLWSNLIASGKKQNYMLSDLQSHQSPFIPTYKCCCQRSSRVHLKANESCLREGSGQGSWVSMIKKWSWPAASSQHQGPGHCVRLNQNAGLPETELWGYSEVFQVSFIPAQVKDNCTPTCLVDVWEDSYSPLNHFNPNSWVRLMTQTLSCTLALNTRSSKLVTSFRGRITKDHINTQKCQHGTRRLCDSTWGPQSSVYSTVHAHVEGTYWTPAFCLIIMDPKRLFLIIIYLYDLLLFTSR